MINEGQSQFSSEIFRRYLLGELSEDHVSEIEEKILLDRAFSEQVMIERGELVDLYVYDLLSEHERGKFESIFLRVPEIREKVLISRAIRKHVEIEHSSKSSENSEFQSYSHFTWPPYRLFSLAKSVRARVSAMLAI